SGTGGGSRVKARSCVEADVVGPDPVDARAPASVQPLRSPSIRAATKGRAPAGLCINGIRSARTPGKVAWRSHREDRGTKHGLIDDSRQLHGAPVCVGPSVTKDGRAPGNRQHGARTPECGY